MKFNNYMGKFASSGDVQTAIDNGDLVKPYVALVEDGNYIDWNTKSETDYSKIPFTIEVVRKDEFFQCKIMFANLSNRNLYYSKNSGEWLEVTENLEVTTGDIISFKGNNTTFSQQGLYLYGTMHKYKIFGNIMSLLYGDNFENKLTIESEECFNEAFRTYSSNGGSLPNEIDASKLVLPATTLSRRCYQKMFQGNNLITAPVLPATTLATSCYEGMFAGSTSLTTAPELPATTLATSCYKSMFNGCSSLTTAPELHATTLKSECYSYMFSNCKSLNYIKCLATDKTAFWSTNNWVDGVASTGTFVKAAGVTWTEGTSGIPTGWTVQEV